MRQLIGMHLEIKFSCTCRAQSPQVAEMSEDAVKLSASVSTLIHQPPRMNSQELRTWLHDHKNSLLEAIRDDVLSWEAPDEHFEDFHME